LASEKYNTDLVSFIVLSFPFIVTIKVFKKTDYIDSGREEWIFIFQYFNKFSSNMQTDKYFFLINYLHNSLIIINILGSGFLIYALIDFLICQFSHKK